METVNQPSFEEDPPRENVPADTDALVVSVDGYEGPIDLLLTMARDQKVDLRQISILALAEQYLSFVERARALRIELAADYLVMAAWLAYLKSKLLLPARPGEVEEELTGEALAEALAFQLQRLEAMQKAAKALFDRPRLGQDRLPVGLAGMREGQAVKIKWKAGLYEILDAYAAIAHRANPKTYEVKTWPLMSMDEAARRLADMIGHMPPGQWRSLWLALDAFVPDAADGPLNTRSALASTLTAALEMVKQERMDLRQEGLFAPILIRTPDRNAANDT
ncbi:MAG: segregation/condensation protein A [Rhodospirillales bacterium]|nr:segregation/condensation protein A [Alphaproteobacteria bacterium]MCB9987593.1 segregation/condensation protein A [Rhodospirillales bacterium]USO07692.1 MAG: segregation/condensation protein A [Rhodospirillales bacterium]